MSFKETLFPLLLRRLKQAAIRFESHQGIEDICNIPDSSNGHERSDEDADDIYNQRYVFTAAIMLRSKGTKAAFTIVIPSDDGGEGEEDQAHHQQRNAENCAGTGSPI